MSDQSKATKTAVARLKRAYGHLGKVIQMVERGEYCIDVIQQNLAVIGHLKSANQAIFNRHLHTCLVQGIKTGTPQKREQLLGEIMHTLNVTAK